MSGPVDATDATGGAAGPGVPAPVPAVVVSDSRAARVGAMEVRRALPNRGRRTVGAWCFVDHAGPIVLGPGQRPDVGPHPHTGLHTVTWLLEGEMLHRDSLGSEQLLRPGQLNLMTAGNGVAHAEEAASPTGSRAHLFQLWVAQPSATRHGAPAFEHHAELPVARFGAARVSVLLGRIGPASSPARRDTELVGADLDLRPGTATLPLDPTFEHALVVAGGALRVEGPSSAVGLTGHLLYLGPGRDELTVTATDRARALLVGGLPFPEPLLMWWNLVARTRQEIEAAYRDWAGDSGRFGTVASTLPRVGTGPPPWVPRRG